MVAVGLTLIDAPVPAAVPPTQLPVYHVHTAPVPSDPPTTLREVLLPKQIGLTLAEALDGAVEKVFTVTVTEAQAVLKLHGAPFS